MKRVDEPARSDQEPMGFVLAGGQSSRMGRDKALIEFVGQPLIGHALSILQDAGLRASIAGAASDLSGFAPVVPDAGPVRGPLGGICAALAATAARHSVFLSVDTPFLPPSLVGFLVHHARVTGRAITISSVNGFAQTFPAVIDRAALLSLKAELAAGHTGCFAAFQVAAANLGQPISSVPVELIAQSGHVAHARNLPAARWFWNLNGPNDLVRAEALAARMIA